MSYVNPTEGSRKTTESNHHGQNDESNQLSKASFFINVHVLSLPDQELSIESK